MPASYLVKVKLESVNVNGSGRVGFGIEFFVGQQIELMNGKAQIGEYAGRAFVGDF